MKKALAFISLAFTAFSQTNEIRFDVLKTRDGQEFRNARISSTTAAYAIVLFDGGGKRIAFTNLSDEIQKQCSYDPLKAEEELATAAKKKFNYQAAQQATGNNALTALKSKYMKLMPPELGFYGMRVNAAKIYPFRLSEGKTYDLTSLIQWRDMEATNQIHSAFKSLLKREVEMILPLEELLKKNAEDLRRFKTEQETQESLSKAEAKIKESQLKIKELRIIISQDRDYNLGSRPLYEWKFISGKIFQVIADGVLFTKYDLDDPKMEGDHELIHVLNFPKSSFVDDEKWYFYALEKQKPYSYLTPLGGSKTIHEYDFGEVLTETEFKRRSPQ